MKIFLSWSGKLSNAIAESLRDWLPQVINAVEPWLSSEDIQKGARWFDEVGASLEQTQFGIICLTNENLASPWVLFEAGALSKSITQSRVSPFLIDLKNSDLTGPLSQFQTTLPTEGEVWKLINTINQSFPNGNAVPNAILQRSFKKWWPDLEAEIDKHLATHRLVETTPTSKSTISPPASAAIEELIESNRSLIHQTAQMLSLFDREFTVSASSAKSPSSSYLTNAKQQAPTIRTFAHELNKAPEILLEQFRAAGIRKNNVDEVISPTDQQQLLVYLQTQHGTADPQRKKITLIKRPKG